MADVDTSITDEGAMDGGDSDELDIDQIVRDVLGGDHSEEPDNSDVGEDASDKTYTIGETTFTEDELNQIVTDYHNDNSWKTKNRLEGESLNKREKELKEKEEKLLNREGLVEKVEYLEKLAKDSPEVLEELDRIMKEGLEKAEYRKEFNEVNQKLSRLELEKVQAELKAELGEKYDQQKILENYKSIDFDDPKQSLMYDYWAYVGKNFEKLLKQGVAKALNRDGRGRPLPPAGGGTSPEPEEPVPEHESKSERVARVTQMFKQGKLG